ncbi:MAG: hypothetical protein HQK53_17405 [Oligoflexia bacterium]|nr:hypothetical protein [Oligoflexia bacterium]
MFFSTQGHAELFRTSSIKIERHTKIIGSANPYNPAYRDYFNKRDKKHQDKDVNVSLNF